MKNFIFDGATSFHLLILFLLQLVSSALSRHQAEALLMQNGENGSYLLRESSTNVGQYSLSVRSLNAVKHFQIGWDGRIFKFGMGRFNNLEDFTKHFQNQPLIGGESGIQLPFNFADLCQIYLLLVLLVSDVVVIFAVVITNS